MDIERIKIPGGTIHIMLEGVEFKHIQRCESIINTMFSAGVFGTRNGQAILHFDHEGNLNKIDMNVIKWKKDKDTHPPLDPFHERAKIKIT